MVFLLHVLFLFLCLVISTASGFEYPKGCLVKNFEDENLVFKPEFHLSMFSALTTFTPFYHKTYNDTLRNIPRPENIVIGNHFLTPNDLQSHDDIRSRSLGTTKETVLLRSGALMQVNFYKKKLNNSGEKFICSIVLINDDIPYMVYFDLDFSKADGWTEQVITMEEDIPDPLHVMLICDIKNSHFVMIDALRYVENHNLLEKCPIYPYSSTLKQDIEKLMLTTRNQEYDFKIKRNKLFKRNEMYDDDSRELQRYDDEMPTIIKTGTYADVNRNSGRKIIKWNDDHEEEEEVVVNKNKFSEISASQFIESKDLRPQKTVHFQSSEIGAENSFKSKELLTILRNLPSPDSEASQSSNSGNNNAKEANNKYLIIKKLPISDTITKSYNDPMQPEAKSTTRKFKYFTLAGLQATELLYKSNLTRKNVRSNGNISPSKDSEVNSHQKRDKHTSDGEGHEVYHTKDNVFKYIKSQKESPVLYNPELFIRRRSEDQNLAYIPRTSKAIFRFIMYTWTESLAPWAICITAILLTTLSLFFLSVGCFNYGMNEVLDKAERNQCQCNARQPVYTRRQSQEKTESHSCFEGWF